MDGFPTASYFWTKDGNQLTSSSEVQLNATSILISSLDVSDAGTYIVTSSNIVGNTTATLTLTVYCKLDNFSVVIILN